MNIIHTVKDTKEFPLLLNKFKVTNFWVITFWNSCENIFFIAGRLPVLNLYVR